MASFAIAVFFQQAFVAQKLCFVVVGNEISKLEGLDGLRELRELVLDKNKIKVGSNNFNLTSYWCFCALHPIASNVFLS